MRKEKLKMDIIPLKVKEGDAPQCKVLIQGIVGQMVGIELASIIERVMKKHYGKTNTKG